MKKHELLVPAGDMHCLRQAVFHGADAVYLACKNFGARKFATNFTNEEIVEAIHFCHLYGVRIYITMNTLIRESEVSSFMEQARFLHKQGVDALIVQDLGMIYLLRKTFPNLEIHASTQANNSSLETIQMFHDLGVKRVVFSRELSIDAIDAIDVPIEKEVFIHGALCVSYSGCCLMSSMIGGRSGNRGECAGSCRLPYSLLKDGKTIKDNQYLLSMKELNTSPSFDRLLHSSIDSFKIEGRMKGPVYVGFITDFYRKLIDCVPFDLEEETKKLKTIFNREFTLGHLFRVEGKKLINDKSPNHVGLPIGTCTPQKDKIKIDLYPGEVLHQFDSIRFSPSNKGMVINYLYDKKGNLCNFADTVCYVDNKVLLTEKNQLAKTQDYLLEKEMIVEESIHKIPVSLTVQGKVGEALSITISCEKHSFSITGPILEKAKSNPTGETVIQEKLSKLGGTPFVLEKIHFELDSDVFIPMTSLNEMRRELVQMLVNARENEKVPFVEETPTWEKKNTGSSPYKACFVRREDQLEKCLALSFDRIDVPKELYLKYKSYPQVFCAVGRCLPCFADVLEEKNMVADVMECWDRTIVGNYMLNITNSYSAHVLTELGYQNIPLSVELTPHEINEVISSYQNRFGNASFEVFIYGRVENMIINSNVLDIMVRSESYTLLDLKKKEYPVFFDGEMTHIYHSNVIDLRGESFPCSIYYSFYQETPEEIDAIVKKK